MASELLTACLDLLETGSDVAAKIPARSPKENHRAAPVAKPISRTPAADVPPRWVLASRRWFNNFSKRHILSIIFGTWTLLVTLSFATSLLVSLLALQAAMFAGAMVFEFDTAHAYRGWRGGVFGVFAWLMFSMAIVPELFLPVWATVDLIHWAERLLKSWI
jgi:hypothetical protein